MSARRLSWLGLALALAAGCAKTSTRPGIRFDGPSAVAVYHGVTTRDAALRSYLAVANARGNDLRILDAIDGTAVLAPGLIVSLSVPTQPRPALLAAGSLHDEVQAADLLVVAPVGLVACDPATGRLSGCVQVVDTWNATTAVASRLTLDLGALAGEGETEILSLVVVPVPLESASEPGTFTAQPGRARVVAGLAGGRLLVADYRRAADGLAIELDTSTFAPDPATPDVTVTEPRVRIHDLGFTPGNLAASPRLARLYASSPDPIGAVEGVAELDLSDPGVSEPGPGFTAPTVRAFDAGAPTTAVMAALVREFVDTPLAGTTTALTPDEYGPEVLRVYAALDPERCGQAEAVACGVVTFDPALGSLADDPAGELPHRAPFPVPGTVLAMMPIYPPTFGGADLAGNEIKPPAATPPVVPELQKLSVPSAPRWASTLAAIGSTTGFTYLADLGRMALANDQWLAVAGAATTPTSVFAVSLQVLPVDEDGVLYPEPPLNADLPRIGIWNDLNPPLDGQGNPLPVVDGADIKDDALVAITPGYSLAEDWRITFEGLLPGLEKRAGQVRVGPAGLEWVAIQEPTGFQPPNHLRGVARLYDVRLGIQPDDIVRITPSASACPAGTPTFEVRVADLLPPDPAAYPGGALAVKAVPALPACLQPATSQSLQATITIRAKDLVLTGSTSGYAGRPVLDVPFALRYEDERALSCPMLESAAWPPPACDAACRATCERLLLARKARRTTYVTERCPTALTDPPTVPPNAEELARKVACEKRWTRVTSPQPDPLAFPNAKGEVVGFRLGKGWTSDATAPVADLRRGTVLFIQVRSGFQPSARRPSTSGSITGDIFPMGYATFDRSAAAVDPGVGVRVFAAYPGNLVMDFSPSTTTISTYR